MALSLPKLLLGGPLTYAINGIKSIAQASKDAGTKAAEATKSTEALADATANGLKDVAKTTARFAILGPAFGTIDLASKNKAAGMVLLGPAGVMISEIADKFRNSGEAKVDPDKAKAYADSTKSTVDGMSDATVPDKALEGKENKGAEFFKTLLFGSAYTGLKAIDKGIDSLYENRGNALTASISDNVDFAYEHGNESPSLSAGYREEQAAPAAAQSFEGPEFG